MSQDVDLVVPVDRIEAVEARLDSATREAGETYVLDDPELPLMVTALTDQRQRLLLTACGPPLPGHVVTFGALGRRQERFAMSRSCARSWSSA